MVFARLDRGQTGGCRSFRARHGRPGQHPVSNPARRHGKISATLLELLRGLPACVS
jgi:hypothetical protein